ncbi:hypothetical protein DPMN_155452 [Dreissena polymorpha]|uniref:Uncharacterized protein n=1 Tax=Dreissena polymorpha TaxID=45954 RepID=A0A9D4FN00_DREPO|nr:hypothetical protein DPMN_155452 [Dreissena polymorpha]
MKGMDGHVHLIGMLNIKFHQIWHGNKQWGREDERAWRDKLAEEMMFEHQEMWGTYEPGFMLFAAHQYLRVGSLQIDLLYRELLNNEWKVIAERALSLNEAEEVCDNWADRIREEYFARKRAQERATFHGNHGNRGQHCQKGVNDGWSDGRSDESEARGSEKRKETLEEARERLRKEFEKNRLKDATMDVLKLRMKYEDRYTKAMEKTNTAVMKYSDVPWPSCCLTNWSRYLRDQQFLQRFGSQDYSQEGAMHYIRHLSREPYKWPCFSTNRNNLRISRGIITTNVRTNFEHEKDIIGTTFLTKFHDNQAINVTFRVLTRTNVDDALRTNGDPKSTP